MSAGVGEHEEPAPEDLVLRQVESEVISDIYKSSLANLSGRQDVLKSLAQDRLNATTDPAKYKHYLEELRREYKAEKEERVRNKSFELCSSVKSEERRNVVVREELGREKRFKADRRDKDASFEEDPADRFPRPPRDRADRDLALEALLREKSADKLATDPRTDKRREEEALRPRPRPQDPGLAESRLEDPFARSQTSRTPEHRREKRPEDRGKPGEAAARFSPWDAEAGHPGAKGPQEADAPLQSSSQRPRADVSPGRKVYDWQEPEEPGRRPEPRVKDPFDDREAARAAPAGSPTAFQHPARPDRAQDFAPFSDRPDRKLRGAERPEAQSQRVPRTDREAPRARRAVDSPPLSPDAVGGPDQASLLAKLRRLESENQLLLKNNSELRRENIDLKERRNDSEHILALNKKIQLLQERAKFLEAQLAAQPFSPIPHPHLADTANSSARHFFASHDLQTSSRQHGFHPSSTQTIFEHSQQRQQPQHSSRRANTKIKFADSVLDMMKQLVDLHEGEEEKTAWKVLKNVIKEYVHLKKEHSGALGPPAGLKKQWLEPSPSPRPEPQERGRGRSEEQYSSNKWRTRPSPAGPQPGPGARPGVFGLI